MINWKSLFKKCAKAYFFPMLSLNNLCINSFRWRSCIQSCARHRFSGSAVSRSTPQLSNLNAMLRSHVESSEVPSRPSVSTWNSEQSIVPKVNNSASDAQKAEIQRLISKSWGIYDHTAILLAFRKARYCMFTRRITQFLWHDCFCSRKWFSWRQLRWWYLIILDHDLYCRTEALSFQ